MAGLVRHDCRDTMLWIAVISRWVHVGTAIVLVGGLVFLRFVLGPAASQLPDDAHAMLKERVLAKWKKFVHAGIALFLLTGFFNYLVIAAPGHKGDKIYHMLMGIKILLALVVFVLSSALVGRSKAFEGIRAKARIWQGAILVIAALIIAISGFVKVALPGKPGGAPLAQSPSMIGD